MKRSKGILLAGVLLTSLLACSCESFYGAMKADPLKPTSFLPNHELLKRQKATFPFDYMWYDAAFDWNRIKSVKFMPVNTSYMVQDDWWQKVSVDQAQKCKQDIPMLANYMRGMFIDKMREYAHNQVSVVETPNNTTAIVHLAIVQLVPTKAFFNAAGTIAGFFIPGAGLVNMANAGCISMECKIYDAKTGKLIAMLSDREKDEAALIDINGLSWYGHAKQTIEVWAKSFAELSTARDSNDVKRDFPISIISI